MLMVLNGLDMSSFYRTGVGTNGVPVPDEQVGATTMDVPPPFRCGLPDPAQQIGRAVLRCRGCAG